MIEANQLIKDLYVGNQLEEMVQRLAPDTLDTHFTNDTVAFKLFIKKWRTLNVDIQKEPEIVASVFCSLFLLTTHEREIGELTYRETINLFIESIVEQLLKEE